jgi:LAO/AO transport system kinase
MTRSDDLIARMLSGDVRALARAISVVEDDGLGAADVRRAAHARAGRACIVGITGPPGAGKSTFVDRMTAEYRRQGRRVAIIAVDPSSPFTGGAILGDRVRMVSHASDSGVFIRSMATRGHLGGLARATDDVAMLADAAGFDVVLIETVGVGQDEVDVTRAADVCLVLTVPGAGDEVQALKAGVMEIADVFVVNKADRDGADQAVAAIEGMLALDEAAAGWRPPVLRTVATTGAGVPEVLAAIESFQAASGAGIVRRRRSRVDWRLREAFQHVALQALTTHVVSTAEWEATRERVLARDIDPCTVATSWLGRLRGLVNMRIDHVAVATDDEAASTAFFRDVLGLQAQAAEDVATQHVRVRFLGRGHAKLELLMPTSDDSVVAKFLRTRGPGVHHVALRVADLDALVAELTARGVRLIDREPRLGAHGTRVAFIHPASTGGVLVELVEAREGGDVDR